MSNSGFVLLDKIAGETSFKALFPLKRVFSTKRVGHAGTLDLRASGLIIAATGRCTRLLPFIEAKDKCYSFRLHLGYETDTLEWDGEVVEQDERTLAGSLQTGACLNYCIFLLVLIFCRFLRQNDGEISFFDVKFYTN